MDDQTILDRITALVDEEHRLRHDAVAPEQRAPGQASVVPSSSDALGITGSPMEAGALATIFSRSSAPPPPLIR